MTSSKKKTAAGQPQPNRQQLLTKLHKSLKSAYKPVPADTSRSVLEQVLFACCLENAHHAAAEKAFETLMKGYFDLNEVRVTTVAELAESLAGLPDPARAALSLRRVLQGVFESTYSFSLDHAKKHSLAHGMKTLENLHGIPPFVVSYIASTTLGGHAIPLDSGALAGLYLCGIISQEEYDAGVVPGIDRLIPKKGGLEFSSLLHQFGADCVSSLHGATVKKIVQGVNPAAAKERFPNRGATLPPPNPPAPPPTKAGQKSEAAKAEELRPAGPQAAARPAGKTPMPPPGSGPKRTADGKPVAGAKPGPKPFVVKPNVGKPITIKQPPPEPPPAKPAPKKAASSKPAPAKASGKTPAKASPAKKVAKGAGKTPGKSTAKGASSRHSSQLAKRKPR
jgi:endonuclease III